MAHMNYRKEQKLYKQGILHKELFTAISLVQRNPQMG